MKTIRSHNSIGKPLCPCCGSNPRKPTLPKCGRCHRQSRPIRWDRLDPTTTDLIRKAELDAEKAAIQTAKVTGTSSGGVVVLWEGTPPDEAMAKAGRLIGDFYRRQQQSALYKKQITVISVTVGTDSTLAAEWVRTDIRPGSPIDFRLAGDRWTEDEVLWVPLDVFTSDFDNLIRESHTG